MRERLRQKVKIYTENKLIIIIAIFSIFILFTPHLQNGIIKGSDSPFHLARIESLAAELRYGTFPVKVHSVLCYDYGYGVGFFYQNHLLYIPAFLQIMGLSLETSFKAFSMLMLIATYILTFIGALKITEDKYCATLAAVAFLFSNQLIYSYYWAFSMGSSLGMIFMPLAIAGMIEFVIKDKPPIMLAFGFWGLACTHMLSAYITFFVCAIILLAYAKKLIKNPKKLSSLILAVGIVLGLSISFWLPMWEQFRQQIYKVAAPWTTPEENTISFKGLFGHSSFGLLFMVWLLLAGIFVIYNRKRLKNKRLIIILLLIDIGIIMAQLMKSFWIIFKPIVEILQFPTRLAAVGVIVLIFAVSLILSQCEMEERQKKIVLIVNISIIMLYAGVSSVGNLRTEREDFTNRILYDEIAGIGAGEEWLPIETTREMMTTPNMATASDGTTIIGEKNDGKFIFLADATKEYFDVPFIWYRGYRAVTDNGILLNIDKNPDTSMVRVYTGGMEALKTQNITVWYAGTKIQKLAYFVNIISIVGLGVVFVLYHKTGKTRGRKSE